MLRKQIIEKVLSDAELLWAIKSSDVIVVNQWETAQDLARKYSYHGVWRRFTENSYEFNRSDTHHIVLVTKSMELREPQRSGCQGCCCGCCDEEYEEEKEKYENELKKWKPWTYRFSYSFANKIQIKNGYADTQEEAQRLADKILTEHGVLLINSLA